MASKATLATHTRCCCPWVHYQWSEVVSKGISLVRPTILSIVGHSKSSLVGIINRKPKLTLLCPNRIFFHSLSMSKTQTIEPRKWNQNPKTICGDYLLTYNCAQIVITKSILSKLQPLVRFLGLTSQILGQQFNCFEFGC